MARAPRYVLGPYDNTTLRIAPNQKGSDIFTTDIVNISETGLLFIAPPSYVPEIGELIKVEFQIPGSLSLLAWHGRVVRLQEVKKLGSWVDEHEEESEPETNLEIGATFYNMPEAHQKKIARHLTEIFEQINREKRRQERVRLRKRIRENTSQFFVLIALVTVLIVFFYFLYTYSSHQGGKSLPWAEQKYWWDQ